jgi:urease accessory protein
LHTLCRLALAALAFTLVPGIAYAHNFSPAVGDFYAGVLHPLTALEHVLPMIGLGILAGQGGRLVVAEPILIVFPLALVAGACLALTGMPMPFAPIANVISMVLVGGLVAAAVRLPRLAAIALAAAMGITHGYANAEGMSVATKPYLFIPGLAAAGLLVPFYCTALVYSLKPFWMQIAVRVAGSWIAATGILVLGMARIR